MHGAAEIRNGDQTAGAGIGIDEFGGCIPGYGLITKVHGGVIKEQDHVARLRVGGGSRAFLKGETGNGLLLAIFPNLEVLLSEIANVVAFLIGDNGIHEDLTRLHTDDPQIGGGRGG